MAREARKQIRLNMRATLYDDVTKLAKDTLRTQLYSSTALLAGTLPLHYLGGPTCFSLVADLRRYLAPSFL
jgi:hypothetical protein